MVPVDYRYHQNHRRVCSAAAEESQSLPCTDLPHSIIAIHGLGTESPHTWEYQTNGRVVNWLADSDMLPAAIPEARIFTYDWDANNLGDSPVQAILNNAGNLLRLVADYRVSEDRCPKCHPIIFVASCFGGLVLAEACTLPTDLGS